MFKLLSHMRSPGRTFASTQPASTFLSETATYSILEHHTENAGQPTAVPGDSLQAFSVICMLLRHQAAGKRTMAALRAAWGIVCCIGRLQDSQQNCICEIVEFVRPCWRCICALSDMSERLSSLKKGELIPQLTHSFSLPGTMV